MAGNTKKKMLSNRTSTFIMHEISDSDQSISEEEGLDDFCLENVVSLDPSARNQGELPLPLRLDFLRGAGKRSLDGNGSSSSIEKLTGAPLEDEVELPDFEEVDFNRPSGEVVANSSDEEITPEDEDDAVLTKIVIRSSTKDRELHKYGAHSIRSEQVGYINEESEALIHVSESVSCSASHDACSKANRSCDGIWSNAKPRFSPQLLSHKHESSRPLISNCDRSVSLKINRLPQAMEAVHPGISTYSVESYIEDDNEVGKDSETEPAEAGLAPRFNRHSMADLVDKLQDKAYLCLPRHSQRKGKKVKHFLIRSRSHMRDRINEDSPEPMDSGSSSDNEVSDQSVKIAFPEKKMQTMADRFQQALGASHVTDEGTHVAALKSFGAGIFGNLQRVMQKEKERDMDFLKKSHSGITHSGLGCVDVKIISRYLDGKLTVCCCSFCKDTEEILLPDNSKRMVCGGRQRTIIFNPRLCDNVDLEVGNMIRVHSPWKEVQVGNDNIILCTYFSEILYPV